jgi:hypothetical protein
MTAGLYLLVDHFGKINTRLSPASERLKEGKECPANTRRTAIASNSSKYWMKDEPASIWIRGDAKQFVFCCDVVSLIDLTVNAIATFSDFRQVSGQELNGWEIEPTFKDLLVMDVTPRPDSPQVDRAVIIPGINDMWYIW